MANPLHLEWLKEGVTAWNKRRESVPFQPDLINANLRHASLDGVNLRQAILAGADLTFARMGDADLEEANLEGAKLFGAVLPRAKMTRARLQEADIRDANLHEVELIEADLTRSSLSYTKLSMANLRAANLSPAQLGSANLRSANLRSANLKGANLREARLEGAHLQEANLLEARLEGSSLENADLQMARLDGASLAETVLSGAQMQGAFFLDVDVRGAEFDGTIVHSLGPSSRATSAGRTDFIFARNLTQAQVDSMDGDTGVLLPDGLTHPSHWPEWEQDTEDREIEAKEPEGQQASQHDDSFEPGSFSPYVFLSYAHEDRENIALIREKLLESGIRCWWDQDIDTGDEWRLRIAEKLSDATVVLTFWTGASVQSKGVVEEAATAQKNRNLSHVRLDQAQLPYGFSETQYQDLVDWGGDANDPRWKRLVSVLNDRLFPPDPEQQILRLGQTGPRSAIPVDGKVGVADTPPDGTPEIEDPPTLQQVFEEIGRSCNALRKLWDLEPPQTPRKILLTIEEAADQAHSEDNNWFTWNRINNQLGHRIAHEDKEAWRGFDDDVESLRKNIQELRKFLKPLPETGKLETVSEQAPEIRLPETDVEGVREISNAIDQLVSDPNAHEVFTEQAIAELSEDNRDLKEGLEDSDNPNERTRQQRFPIWRFALRGIAGFAATAVAIMTGASVNLLTSPEAAKTLASHFQHVLDLILKFV